MRVVWVSTWDRTCGIADYSKALWPALQSSLKRQGHEGLLVSLDEYKSADAVIRKLQDLKADGVHFQHEYGIYGGKNPPGYFFPKIIQGLKSALPQAVIVATAHTVLSPDYRFPVEGRGWQIPVRTFANRFLLKYLTKVWGQSTWGSLSGVILHSRHQIDSMKAAQAQTVEVIPHFVPASGVQGTITRKETRYPIHPGLLGKLGDGKKNILVFGFFTPEKGQDLAIEAFAKLGPEFRLVLAGGVRRPLDQTYYEQCLKQIEKLRVRDRVVVTGFVEPRYLDGLYQVAEMVLVPFRETSGSGSLAQALARKSAILASDLVLNQEIAERTPGSIAFFKSGDAKDCAIQIQKQISDADAKSRLSSAAMQYAIENSPSKIADRHVEFYLKLRRGLKP